MTIYAINYDLKKPGRNYDGLHEEIKRIGIWWHYLDSTWLVKSNLRAPQIWDRLQKHVDNNDVVLVIEVTTNYSGWLSKQAWEWIRKHIGE